jgi:hypothetical protein
MFPLDFPQQYQIFAPFNLIFALGKRKKLDGAKSGEYNEWGTTAILFLAKNSCII